MKKVKSITPEAAFCNNEWKNSFLVYTRDKKGNIWYFRWFRGNANNNFHDVLSAICVGGSTIAVSGIVVGKSELRRVLRALDKEYWPQQDKHPFLKEIKRNKELPLKSELRVAKIGFTFEDLTANYIKEIVK